VTAPRDFFAALEGSAAPSVAELNEAVRGYLQAVRAGLLERHERGDPAQRINEDHADAIDALIRELHRTSEQGFFRAHLRLASYGLAVVAVGGYGRRELSLASDVDLLFLYRGKLNAYVETLSESIQQRLWDGRLVVGSATRTVSDSLALAREDLSTFTSLLDARLLCGDPRLFEELEGEVQRRLRRDAAGFIEGKLAEQRDRHLRYGESLYLLQPNLRESVGGLRDYHTALWVARAVHWEVRRAEHLRVHGFVDDRELADLLAALEFLWRVRNDLHRGGRKDDRLHYGVQEKLAARLGFRGTDEALGVEELMRCYYTHARAIQRANERTIDHALEGVRLRQRRRRPASRPLEEGFVLADGRLEIPHAGLLAERPARLFSAFAVAQQHEVELSARAQRLLREHLHLIDDRFREDAEVAEIFRGILRSARRVYRTLVRMSELGLLGAYLHEFGSLVGLWQQDMYHTYTVDVHSLFLIEQLRRLLRGQFSSELALPSELVREVSDPLVLYLGCILHDIGKGRGGDHSGKGAALVPPIAKRLGLSDEQTEHVQFLVLHHLTLSALAERRDVHDARLILNVARLVETRARLRSLYLLTVADIRSVSREAWTHWKGGLLEALYRNAAEWLEAGVEDASAPGFFLQRAVERAARTEQEVTALLAGRGVPADETAEFLSRMPRRYLLSHDAREVAQHVRAALAYLRGHRPASVALFEERGEADPFLGLIVLAPDRPGLFATVAGVLHASGHNVLGAQVYTTRDHLALEIYQLSPIPGEALEQEEERARIERRLCDVLEGRVQVAALIERREPRPQRPVRAIAPEVRVSNDESDFYSIVDVTATDRVGLLHDVTQAMANLGLDVVIARAATRANRVDDSFYVTDGGHKIAGAERHAEVEAAILAALERGEG
jgi:[protein-PII] uridylyltransferase